MRKNKKNKIIKFFSNKDLIYSLCALVFSLIIVAIFELLHNKYTTELSRFFEVKTYLTIFIFFILNMTAYKISNFCRKKIEEANRLNIEYNELVSKYSRCKTFVEVKNEKATKKNVKIGKAFTHCVKGLDETSSYTLPVFDVVPLRGKKIQIIDNKKMYELNDYAKENMKEFSQIYSATEIYNNTYIRLDDFIVDKKSVVLYTSRTKYYYSLITNRAIDYKINNISYRELFEEGPFVNSLKESSLSNHLGINGFVETKDGVLIFILRHKKVTIGKNTLQNSIGAALKAKYALDDNKNLTIKGIEKAIINEIIDELHLDRINLSEIDRKKLFSKFSFKKNVLYFYRDLVEGGKPQLLFYTKLELDASEIKQAFNEGISKDRKNKDKFALLNKIDGHKMILVEKSRLNEIFIGTDCIVIDGKPYSAMPSALASFALIKEYLIK